MAVRIVSYSRAIFLISPIYRFNRSGLRDKRREPSFPKLSEVKADVFIRQVESSGLMEFRKDEDGDQNRERSL